MVAVVDGGTMLLTISDNTVLPLKITTHTLPEMELAAQSPLSPESLDTPEYQLKVILNCKPPLMETLFPLVLMPLISNFMEVESLTIAELESTTESQLLDIQALIGPLRIHGELDGENQDISD